jgi:hypothetical protein
MTTNIPATGYLASTITSSRVDLSSVFMPLQFGGQYTETGYKLSNGDDLNTLFCKNYTDVSANKTSLLLSDGQDLSDVFEKRHNVGYSTKVTTTNGLRVVYPFTSSSIYCGGDRGTFGIWNGNTTINAISGIATGTNDSVRAIYAINASNVYIGGLFTSVNSDSNMAYLAKYNGTGTSFSRVISNSVLNNYILAMSALDPSNVYIGGAFTNANIGIRISILNTHSNTFTPLTSQPTDVSLNNVVAVISALNPSNVYIGGAFTNAGNVGTYVTRWDGTQFNRLGNDYFSGGSQVLAIYALDENHVYIGGSFTQYGTNTNINRIAMWDGTNMIALGNGLAGADIRAIYALDENHVYIGGSSIDHIKMWNGSSFSQLSGSSGLASCFSMNMLANVKTTLYFGGISGVNKWTT